MRSLFVALLACVLFTSCDSSGRLPFPAPVTPSGLRAVLLDPTSVGLFWLDAKGAREYRLERALDGAEFAIIATLDKDTTTYKDLGLESDTVYCYRITASNAIGDSPVSGVIKIFTDSRPPVQVTDVQATSAFHLGGAEIRIEGRGFLAGGPTTVTIDNEDTTDLTILSDTLLKCTVPGVDHRDTGKVLRIDVRNDVGVAIAGFTYFQWGPIPGVLTDEGPIFNGDEQIDGRPSGMGEASDPVVCGDGLMVYAAWEDDRDGADDIYFNRSTDGGRTWMPSATLISTTPPGMFEAENVQLACNGMTVHAVWPEETAGAEAVYYRRSTDGGQNWEPVIRLDSASPTDEESEHVRICIDGSTVAVTWEEGLRDKDIFANVSVDNGTTFAGERQVDTGGDNFSPEVACTNGVIHVVWSEDDNSNVLHSRSVNGGQTFSAPFIVNTTFGEAIDILVCAKGDTVHTAYFDFDDDAVHYNRSLDGGLTWLLTDKRVSDGNSRANAFKDFQMACDELGVYVVWRDNRTGRVELFSNRSLDFGETWLPADVQVSASNGTADDMRIAAGGGAVYIVWEDRRFGKKDIMSSGSIDAGATWFAQNKRIAASRGTVTDADTPAIYCDGARIHVVWEDRRSQLGADDVFYAGNVAK